MARGTVIVVLVALAGSLPSRAASSGPGISLDPAQLLRDFLNSPRPPAPPAGPVQVPAPGPQTRYGARITVEGAPAEDRRAVAVRAEAAEACRQVQRALFGLQNHFEEVPRHFGERGINAGILRRNRDFYAARLGSLYRRCTAGELRFRLVGRCNTPDGTLAFVRVPFGRVIPVVNVCDEYFDGNAEVRRSTLVHEYGRLEGIGDGPDFGTDHIYVWDRVVDMLADPRFQEAAAARGARAP